MTKILEKEIEGVRFQLEKAKRTTDYTLFLEKKEVKKYVLSKYDPKNDIQKRLEGKFANKETLFIIMGFACGYVLEFIEKKLGNDYTAIVIEPSKEMLEKQIELRNCFQLSRYKNVRVFCGINFGDFTQIAREVIGINNANNIEPIFMDGYDWAYPSYYKEILNRLVDIRNGLLLNQNTYKEFGNLWIRNIIKNRHSIEISYDITKLKEKFKDIPAVVVSGGPSLDKNIQYIKDFKGLVFTGGRTVAPVLKYGVMPDFVCSIDPEEETFDTFLEYGVNEFPLITTPTSSSKVIENNSGPQYFVTNDNFSKNLIGIDGQPFDMGGSVATLCLSAASYMGCNPIIFIGQDLAFANGQTHTLMNQAVTSFAEHEKRGYKKIKGYYGDEVETDAALITYLRWIEAFIAYYSDKTYINATQGGAWIQGAENQTFEEVTKKYENIKKPNIMHTKREHKVNVDLNINQTLDVLKQVSSLAQRGMKFLKALRGELHKYQGKRIQRTNLLIEQCKDISNQIMRLEDKIEVISAIFKGQSNDVNMNLAYKEKLNETDAECNIRLAIMNYDMYSKLYSSSQETIDTIEQALKER